MCGIAGFYTSNGDYQGNSSYFNSILQGMIGFLQRRGPDDNGTYLSSSFALAHTRLSIIDLKTGHQPIIKNVGGYNYGIVYNGETYNMNELKKDLEEKGWKFETTTDTEVALLGFLEYGVDFVKRMTGIFAFAIMDEKEQCIYLFRDRLGLKPLFYHISDNEIVFASEIKALFAHPKIKPQVDASGLNEIFSVGPAKTYGCGIFKGIDEVLPGCFLRFGKEGLKKMEYWQLESHLHTDSFEETVEKTSYLLKNAITMQMISDVPICTFLSGGLDSSIVSAVCSEELKKQGKQLTTFSFDFKSNNEYFKANDFQPSEDRPYVDKMVAFLDSDHHYLECDNLDLADRLYDSVDARDFPSMADVDSSLLHFCSLVKAYNKVALTGECADEIFGGYPWFHKEEFFSADTFPWSRDLTARKALLSDEFLSELKMDEYVKNTYEKSLAETPRLEGEGKEEARRREIAYLNIKWFMQTLLDRMDRSSMYSGLEGRCPFSDHKLIEYVWNVPWEMKKAGGVVKGLLREASKDLLPDEILYRRKSPYPKTYDPRYEELLKKRFRDILADSSSPVLAFIDKNKANKFLSSPSDYGKPWYGQLMAGPQMIAYMIQVNYWLKKFNIEIL